MDMNARHMRSEGFIEAEAGGETVMMNLELGKYFGLNAVASYIWSLIDQPRTIAELREAVCSEFAVSPDQCEQDVIAFVPTLIDRGLVRRVG